MTSLGSVYAVMFTFVNATEKYRLGSVAAVFGRMTPRGTAVNQVALMPPLLGGGGVYVRLLGSSSCVEASSDMLYHGYVL